MRHSKTLNLFESFKNELENLNEKFMEFPTEKEKDEYIKDNNLIKDKDYIDKGINAIELLNDSEKLDEKINKDNIEINKALANPNLGKNQDRIKQAGYDIEYDGDYIKNPKTGKGIWPKDYNKDEKKKVDFKGKLDSERKNSTDRIRPEYAGKGKQIPSSAVYKKTDKYAVVDRDSAESYYDSAYRHGEKKSISNNINDYKQAVGDRDEALDSVEFNKGSTGYYEDKVKKAQRDLDNHNNFINRRQKEADVAENKRKEIIDKIRAKRKTESEEFLKESEDFEDKLKALYNSYKQDGMEDAFWSDLMNCIDNLEYLNQWYDSLNEE